MSGDDRGRGAWSWGFVRWRSVASGGLAALSCVLVWFFAPHARSDAVLDIRPLPPLLVGERAALEVRLQLPEQASPSLLLSTDAEGAAVDVVRGRMMRGDAVDPEARPLVFEVPLVARGEGQSVVRVRVDAYLCTPRCRPAYFDARTVIEVRRQTP